MTGLDALAGAGWRAVRPGTERVVRVRRAEGSDREALARMFDRCAPSTRYSRFHGPVKAIPERYLAEALSGSPFHYALVACPPPVVNTDTDLAPAPAPDAVVPASGVVPAGEVVALASCRLIDEGAAELGVLIEDTWQHHGLGTRLVSDLVTYASGIGLRVLEAQLLVEQSWIAGLLRPYGTCRVRPAWSGVLQATVRLGERSA